MDRPVDPEPGAPEAVAALVEALEARTLPPGEVQDRLERAVSAVRQAVREEGVPLPRRVGIALGLALQTAPHLLAVVPPAVRLGSVEGEPPVRGGDPLLPVVPEVLEERVGLPQWELEELQEEIDRRTGWVLKQHRLAAWLTDRFVLPDPAGRRALAGRLFPELSDPRLDVVRRGSHLYVLGEHDGSVPEAALWLPWLAPQAARAPTSFRPEAVDPALRAQAGRSLGLSADEVDDLLAGMVALLPREGAGSLLALERWRFSGRAALTEVGMRYGVADRLAEPLGDEGANWRSWLRVEGEGLRVRGHPRQVFDALALPRVSALTQTLYGLLLAVVDRDGAGVERRRGLRQVHRDLLDLPRHLRAVLHPLLDWVRRRATHEGIAEETGLRVEVVQQALLEVHACWLAEARRSWLAPPGAGAPSVLTLLTRHLLATWASLDALLVRRPDPRGPHADLLLLFTAHYLREARLERLWVARLSDVAGPGDRVPPPEDVPGAWFWPALKRVLGEEAAG